MIKTIVVCDKCKKELEYFITISVIKNSSTTKENHICLSDKIGESSKCFIDYISEINKDKQITHLQVYVK